MPYLYRQSFRGRSCFNFVYIAFSVGGYLVFESYTAAIGEVARVVSTPVANLVGQNFVCLSFWYHMYGADMGILTVLRRDLTSGIADPLWELSGDQKNQWYQGRAPLLGVTPYQVRE